jgi:hypothetical protein
VAAMVEPDNHHGDVIHDALLLHQPSLEGLLDKLQQGRGRGCECAWARANSCVCVKC